VLSLFSCQLENTAADLKTQSDFLFSFEISTFIFHNLINFTITYIKNSTNYNIYFQILRWIWYSTSLTVYGFHFSWGYFFTLCESHFLLSIRFIFPFHVGQFLLLTRVFFLSSWGSFFTLHKVHFHFSCGSIFTLHECHFHSSRRSL
jgi:hypothetical protein